MEWNLTFVHNDAPNSTLASRVLFFLVSRGARYNTSAAPGNYMVSNSVTSESDYVNEPAQFECTERIGEILEEYQKLDPETTALIVSLDFKPSRGFPFKLIIRPVTEDKCRVELRTHRNSVPDSESHDAFVEAAKELFERMGFAYGTYTNENDPVVPADEEMLLNRPVQAITFYNADLADQIGRERLLSIPAGHAEELSNGGVLLYICSNQFGGCPELDEVRQYLEETNN